jgi:chromate transporter
MKATLKDIFIEFLLLGLQLLGGGYVIVPLMKKAFIEQREWITEEELANYYALSQSLPGVIAINISAFVGYKLRGIKGAGIALLGIITTPIAFILAIAAIMDKLLKFSYIQCIFWAVGIAVIILVYLSVKEIWQQSMKSIFSWVIYISTIIASFYFKLSPTTIIVIALILGISYKVIKEKRKK